MPSPPDSSSDTSALHRWLWRWHGYAGLFVIPFIFFMALTGIPYVWEQELENGLHPEYRALTPGAARVSYEEQLVTARAACADLPLLRVKVDGDPRHATGFQFGTAFDPTTVFIDPYTGRVITTIREWTRVSFAAVSLHGLTFIEPYGSWLLELLACWGIILCATGVYLWWPRGRGWKVWGVFLPRLRADGRTRWRDIHAVSGFYFAAVLAFYLVTGLPWTAFWGSTFLGGIQNSTGQALPAAMTDESGLRSTPPKPGAHPLPLDAFVAFGLAQNLPGRLEIALPTTPDGTVHVRNRCGDYSREHHFQLDLFTAQTLGETAWPAVPISWKAVLLGIGLHEGVLLGRLTQIAATALSCLFMLLAGAAATMWWQRRPQGRLDWPRRIERVVLPVPLRTALIIAAVLMPLAGLSMLALGLVERLRSATDTPPTPVM